SEEEIIAVPKESEAGVETGQLRRGGTRSRGRVFIDERVSSVSWGGLANGMPLAEPHGHSDNLPNHFCLLRISKHPRRHRGKRMGLKNDFLTGQCTPAAGVAITGFNEVNGPFVFRMPDPLKNLVP